MSRLGRPSAVLDADFREAETAIAVHGDAARKIGEVVATHVVAAYRLNEVALADAQSAIAVYESVENALRASRVWADLPFDVRSIIGAIPEQLRTVNQDCVCVDRETHAIGCKLRTIYRSHRELIDRYRAHNVALVCGTVSA